MYPQRYFVRVDENDDDRFYDSPRLVTHIDAAAIAATTALYGEYLPENSEILDLMSSWRSHLPTDRAFSRVVGLGMNAVELRENPQLSEFVVQNLNRTPMLPFDDARFDGCVLTVSIQYLTQPIEVCREVARVLRPNAPFLIAFSNRMFPTKAVAVWRGLDDSGHLELVGSYLRATGSFDRIEQLDRSPRRVASDPLFAVVGHRLAEA